MAVTIPVETTYDDSGVRDAEKSLEGAGKEFEAAGGKMSKAFSGAGAALGDAFRAGAAGAGEAVAAAGAVIASGGSIGDAWNAAAGELATAATQMVAAIGESVIAEQGAAIASKAWAAAQWLVNTSFLGFPLVWLLVGLVALIAIIVLLWKKSDTFRAIVTAAFDGFLNAVKAVWNWLKANWATILVILLGPIAIAVKLIIGHWDQIKAGAKAVLDWLKGSWKSVSGLLTQPFEDAWAVLKGIFGKIEAAVQRVIDFISRIHIPSLKDLNPFSRSAPQGASYYATPAAYAGGYGVGAAPASVTSWSPTLNLYGAVDPEGTAREVQRLLDKHSARQGRVSGAPRRRAW